MKFDYEVGNAQGGRERSERIVIYVSRAIYIIKVWTWVEHPHFTI